MAIFYFFFIGVGVGGGGGGVEGVYWPFVGILFCKN